MKKYIFICIVLLVVLVSFKFVVSAKANNGQWTKINKHIYIDESSITETVGGTSAWFKIYDLSKIEAQRDKFDGTPIYYKIIKYDAACDPWALFIEHIKYYGKNGVLLSDEENNHGIGADCGAYIDGETICKALCKK